VKDNLSLFILLQLKSLKNVPRGMEEMEGKPLKVIAVLVEKAGTGNRGQQEQIKRF
jgi:hypothetical protein